GAPGRVCARHRAARHGRYRGLQPAAGVRRLDPGHLPHRARRRDRPRGGTRTGRRRLRHQALQPTRTGGPDQGDPAPGRRTGAVTPPMAAQPTVPPPVAPAGPPPPPRPPFRFARTLTVRAILTTCTAAPVSVLVTALVAFPVALGAVNRAARQGLNDKARLVADLIGPRLANGRVDNPEPFVKR